MDTLLTPKPRPVPLFVRVSPKTYSTLQRIKEETNRPLTQIIEALVNQHLTTNNQNSKESRS